MEYWRIAAFIVMIYVGGRGIFASFNRMPFQFMVFGGGDIVGKWLFGKYFERIGNMLLGVLFLVLGVVLLLMEFELV
ncbi:MAG TPA: hypothetical protein VK658_28320 [Chryseolinea sp.]|nr:hypothetical protein [Chryseolinea sp.]